MSKKKHPEHVNHERWLVSYADFITLLFAFFVVLFASGQSDKRKTVELARAMQSAFTYNGVFDAHSKTPPISQDAVASTSGTPSPIAVPVPPVPNLSAEAAVQNEKHIREAVAKAVVEKTLTSGAVTLRGSEQGLVVSLHEAGFFQSGSAEIRPEALAALIALARALPHQAMRVEGHTDDQPIHTPLFASNWELSTARAAAITRLLLSENATRPEWISAAGYAEFHPVVTNETDAGRAQNRRVDIVLLQSDARAIAPEPESARRK
jgi:chemotaxis protein MotB